MIFGRKEIEITGKKTLLNVSQFSSLLRKETQFDALVAVVGPDAAEESLKDMHWLYTGRYNLKGALVMDGDWGAALADFRRILTAQKDRALRTKWHIDRLFMSAMADEGGLGQELRKPENIMPMAEYGATDRDIDAVKGAKWIVRASNSNEKSVEEIADILIRCRARDLSVFDLGTLEYLHEQLVPAGSIVPRRPLNVEQPWTSSGAAKVLQRKVADKVRALGARKKLLSDSDWDGIACFFLGAYMRTHGFSDGNGRPNRALFVLSLIEGFRPFVAPKPEFTKEKLVNPA